MKFEDEAPLSLGYCGTVKHMACALCPPKVANDKISQFYILCC